MLIFIHICSKLKWKNYWESKTWQNSPDKILVSVVLTCSLKVVASRRAKEENWEAGVWKCENDISVYDLPTAT